MTVIAPPVAVDPEVHSGEPVIAGTRVPVSVIVGAVAAGDTIEEVAQEYRIDELDVRAALRKLLEGETVRAAHSWPTS
jgi:uncharacterized protein (DUF433 family)